LTLAKVIVIVSESRFSPLKDELSTASFILLTASLQEKRLDFAVEK